MAFGCGDPNRRVIASFHRTRTNLDRRRSDEDDNQCSRVLVGFALQILAGFSLVPAAFQALRKNRQ